MIFTSWENLFFESASTMYIIIVDQLIIGVMFQDGEVSDDGYDDDDNLSDWNLRK